MLAADFLKNVRSLFIQLKDQGEKAMAQIPDDRFTWQYNPETNSIEMIVKHLSGNMISRFTDFLTSDGEKSWRDRDGEFDAENLSRGDLIKKWDQGWACVFAALDQISESNLSSIVYIRKEPHTVLDAINRQVAHYAGHIGQIIYLGKMVANDQWKTLTIPRRGSAQFNAAKGLS